MSDIPQRPTIGFLSANINSGSSRPLWPGVLQAARDLDANLILLPGGALGGAPGAQDPRNLVYELVSPTIFDGLVSWASTLGAALPTAVVTEFHRRFEPLPVVSLALPMPGFPTVLVDSYAGMRLAISHLVEEHGLRRLVFVRGPESHFYAQQRYQAYQDALAHYGIASDPCLVTPPLPWDGGVEAMRIILDERGLVPGRDFQAVVAVSDLQILGAFQVLQARGVAVPATVAMVGFNNSTEGRLNSPPLTSVVLPLREQGYCAAEELVGMLRGKPPAETILMPARMIVRQSCGCPPQAVVEAALIPKRKEVPPLGPPPSRSTSNGRLDKAARLESVRAAIMKENALPEWPAQLLAAFDTALREHREGAFLGVLEQILRHAADLDVDLTAWQGVISALRRHTLPGLRGSARLRCEDLCGQARVIIGEMAQRSQAYRLLLAERQAEALRDIGLALITVRGVSDLVNVLAEQLPRLGIVSGFLAVYENPTLPLENARLILAFNEHGRIELEPDGLPFPTRQLAPPGLMPQRRCDLVVEPLYYHAESIGFAIFEIGPLDGMVYEVLRTQISSALKGAMLFAEAQLQKRQLAESEMLLKELAIRDSLTGLYNRRYMQETLERELLRAARKQLSLGMIMIDIDFFKKFNDRFGHPAGDEMLRYLSTIFRGHIRDSDMAYRYGGEEFILVMPETSLEVTRQRAELLCSKVPQLSIEYDGQPLPPVTISLGVAVFPMHGSSMTELLKAADAALYRAKGAGRNQVKVADEVPSPG